jgi:serine/threonine protein kinase
MTDSKNDHPLDREYEKEWMEGDPAFLERIQACQKAQDQVMETKPVAQAMGSVLRAIGDGSIGNLLLRDLEDEVSPMERPRSKETESVPIMAGQYQVFGEIGRGGMGAVLKGRDVDLGREVAIKVLLEQHAGDRGLMGRFLEEAQISGQLQHPGIVPLYGLGLFSDRRPFFAMKLVKGRTLSALLDARKDASEDRHRFVGIFHQICQTVAYAHARGVIHRDLKPSNVMVGNFGEVQVMDWGLAKVLPREEDRNKGDAQKPPQITSIKTVRTGKPDSESQPGAVMGTAAYMPPEQARGKVEDLDERCDVFGLGAILCQILTGHPPYVGVGTTTDEVCRDVWQKAEDGEIEEGLERMERSGADEGLIRIAKRCLAPRRHDRYRDAGALTREVAGYLASVEERAYPGP